MNIARGLLWNQEPAISRGVQVNYSNGPVNASVSVNDGFYSGDYNWVSGLVSYAATPSSTITLVAAGNFAESGKTGAATPLAQNNSSIFNVIYTYVDGPLTLQPYLQYTTVRSNRDIGIDRSAETFGGALLARYAINENFDRWTRRVHRFKRGDCGVVADCAPTNLLYGPKSRAWSLTVTLTYQRGIFFAHRARTPALTGSPKATALGPISTSATRYAGCLKLGCFSGRARAEMRSPLLRRRSASLGET